MALTTYRLDSVSSTPSNTTESIAVENRSDNAVGTVMVTYTSKQHPEPKSLLITDSLAAGTGKKQAFDHDGIQITSFSVTWQQSGFPESTGTEQQPGSYLLNSKLVIHNDFHSITYTWKRFTRGAGR